MDNESFARKETMAEKPQESFLNFYTEIKKFYTLFPNTNAVRSQLTWTHYRAMLRVENDIARN